MLVCEPRIEALEYAAREAAPDFLLVAAEHIGSGIDEHDLPASRGATRQEGYRDPQQGSGHADAPLPRHLDKQRQVAQGRVQGLCRPVV